MKLEKRRYDDVVILKFTGEFDAFNLPTFSAKIDAMVAAGDRQLVLDLHALKFINSAALGYLIKMGKRLKDSGGGMVVARPSKFIQKTLATLGLDTVFTAYQTVEDGILHFKKGESIGKIDIAEGEYDETLTGAVPLLFRKDDKANLPPNQVGRIVTLYEDGLLFRYEPSSKGGKDPVEADLVEGAKLKIKFRQPFAVKDHYFEMAGTISQVSKLSGAPGSGEEGVVTARIKYDRIRDDDRKHLAQLVRDLDSWKA
jgi:anti-anti-sigma factor